MNFIPPMGKIAVYGLAFLLQPFSTDLDLEVW